MKPDKSTLESYVQEYGSNAMSYSTLQNGLEYCHYSGKGFIAYTSLKDGTCVALSDPICDPSDFESLLNAFMNDHSRVSFLQVTDAFAPLLHEYGFYVNEMGIETEVNIPTFTYSGNMKEHLRRNSRKALDSGVTVREVDDIVSLRDELEKISDGWIKTKIVDNKEIWFAARRMVYEPELGVRTFVAYQDDSPEAFVTYDPIFENGSVIGYYADILRSKPESHKGSIDLINRTALEQFNKEGKERFSLGISPFCTGRENVVDHLLLNASQRSLLGKSSYVLYALKDIFTVDKLSDSSVFEELYGDWDVSYHENPVMRFYFDSLYKTKNRIYPFENLTYKKSRYGGGFLEGRTYKDDTVSALPVYWAQQNKIPIMHVNHVFDMTGITDSLVSTGKKLLFPKKA